MTSADLSENDVGELGAFLLGTCDDVSRWLPPPLWVPAWRSEAEQECWNTEQGQLGPWGQDPARAVYAGGALYLDTILDCLRSLARTLTPETTAPRVTLRMGLPSRDLGDARASSRWYGRRLICLHTVKKG